MIDFVGPSTDKEAKKSVLKNFTFRLRYPVTVLDSLKGNRIAIRERVYEAHHFDKSSALQAICLISPHFCEAFVTYPERLKCEITELTDEEKRGIKDETGKWNHVEAGSSLSFPRHEIGSWPDDEIGRAQATSVLAFTA